MEISVVAEACWEYIHLGSPERAVKAAALTKLPFLIKSRLFIWFV